MEPQEIINEINKLEPAQRRELAQLIRATPTGIRAYQAFIFGGGLSINEQREDEGEDTTA